ncbi:unnamed protein product [Somion occarium]|uniref:Uncharacterized protein n=1 Tax=Somion occarium TaxID=3059160 RepID=A0ABP1D5M2_9APHY
MRLPSYRTSHLGRFHPYGRKAARTRHQEVEADFMRTIDSTFDVAIPQRPSLTLSVITEESVSEMLESGYSAHDATPFSRVEELVVASNQAQAEKTAGLMELIVDFAHAMIRRLRLSKGS